MKRVAMLLLAALPGAALAQASACRIPARIDVPRITPPDRETIRAVPVRGYTLALSWSPEYCRDNPQDQSEQCRAATGRFGFILHGLWPEGAGKSAPLWCPAQRPLTEAVIKAQFCTTPSTRLIAYEWAKHGSCAANDPADYFAAARKLFASVRLPDMDALSRRTMDVGGFKRIISALNPAIAPSAIAVSADRRGWLSEVRICLNVALRPEPCPRSRPQGAGNGTRLRIWRATP